VGVVVVLTVMAAHRAALADDYDFEDFARRTGCDSVIFSDRRYDCGKIQENVNKYCKEQRFDCSIRDFKSVLSDYRDLQGRSTSSESEKTAKDEKLAKLKKDLDDRVAEAARGTPIATQCVQYRGDIFEHFKKTSDMTATAGKTQMAVRQALLDKLKAADERRNQAKNKRDASPNDDSLKREYDEAAEAYRKVEQELGEFNRKNGQDIEKNYSRLVDQYERGNREHAEERQNQQNRLDNCKEITSTRY
jgi:hypothetical protein